MARSQSAGAWSDALQESDWLGQSQILKSDGAAWVRRAAILGHDVVVKCRPLDSIARRIKAAAGFDQFDRHWRAAERMRQADLRHGAPILLARANVEGRPCNLLVLEHVDGVTLLHLIRESAAGRIPVSHEHAVARQVGVFIARMSRGRLSNRDHKPSNVVLAGEVGQEPQVSLIDLVGVRRDKSGNPVRLLASLVIEPTGCGVPPRRALMARVIHALLDEAGVGVDDNRVFRHARFRALWREVSKRVLAHGDLRPRVAPR